MKLLQAIILICTMICNIYAQEQKKAIIIGASSGMGREVAKLLSKDGYTVGLTARRLHLLESLQQELSGPSFVQELDVTAPDARQVLQSFITTMGGLDLIVISISPYLDNHNELGFDDSEKSWQKKSRCLDVCFTGFIAMADVALAHFKQQNSGHLVGISSTSGLRGSGFCPEYSGAKAGISCYMEGVRNQMFQNNLNIHVTDVIAGYVAVEHSPFGQDPAAYWEITCQQAGQAIIAGIKAQQKIVYVPCKCWLIALILNYMPDYIYNNYFPWL